MMPYCALYKYAFNDHIVNGVIVHAVKAYINEDD